MDHLASWMIIILLFLSSHIFEKTFKYIHLKARFKINTFSIEVYYVVWSYVLAANNFPLALTLYSIKVPSAYRYIKQADSNFSFTT